MKQIYRILSSPLVSSKSLSIREKGEGRKLELYEILNRLVEVMERERERERERWRLTKD